MSFKAQAPIQCITVNSGIRKCFESAFDIERGEYNSLVSLDSPMNTEKAYDRWTKKIGANILSAYMDIRMYPMAGIVLDIP